MAHALHAPAPLAVRQVRVVAPQRTLHWLRRGAADFAHQPGFSLACGALVAGFGVALLALAWGASYLVPAFAGGFLLVAPFLAIGLCALARQLDAGERVSTAHAVFAWRRNGASFALFGLMLALALILWERVAAIVFALTYGGIVPELDRLVDDLLFAPQYLALRLAFFACGAAFAALVFALSVVTAPMLLDRPVDLFTAAATSWRCCARNPGTMLLWALLVAALTVLAMATAMLALVVVFPWLGYASWHAYRDLVD
ncbi:MAG: DUF2189 domain-containing protein [Gammaproteobacteria bacterium]